MITFNRNQFKANVRFFRDAPGVSGSTKLDLQRKNLQKMYESPSSETNTSVEVSNLDPNSFAEAYFGKYGYAPGQNHFSLAVQKVSEFIPESVKQSYKKWSDQAEKGTSYTRGFKNLVTGTGNLLGKFGTSFASMASLTTRRVAYNKMLGDTSTFNLLERSPAMVFRDLSEQLNGNLTPDNLNTIINSRLKLLLDPVNGIIGFQNSIKNAAKNNDARSVLNLIAIVMGVTADKVIRIMLENDNKLPEEFTNKVLGLINDCNAKYEAANQANRLEQTMNGKALQLFTGQNRFTRFLQLPNTLMGDGALSALTSELRTMVISLGQSLPVSNLALLAASATQSLIKRLTPAQAEIFESFKTQNSSLIKNVREQILENDLQSGAPQVEDLIALKLFQAYTNKEQSQISGTRLNLAGEALRVVSSGLDQVGSAVTSLIRGKASHDTANLLAVSEFVNTELKKLESGSKLDLSIIKKVESLIQDTALNRASNRNLSRLTLRTVGQAVSDTSCAAAGILGSQAFMGAVGSSAGGLKEALQSDTIGEAIQTVSSGTVSTFGSPVMGIVGEVKAAGDALSEVSNVVSTTTQRVIESIGGEVSPKLELIETTAEGNKVIQIRLKSGDDLTKIVAQNSNIPLPEGTILQIVGPGGEVLTTAGIEITGGATTLQDQLDTILTSDYTPAGASESVGTFSEVLEAQNSSGILNAPRAILRDVANSRFGNQIKDSLNQGFDFSSPTQAAEMPPVAEPEQAPAQPVAAPVEATIPEAPVESQTRPADLVTAETTIPAPVEANSADPAPTAAQPATTAAEPVAANPDPVAEAAPADTAPTAAADPVAAAEPTLTLNEASGQPPTEATPETPAATPDTETVITSSNPDGVNSGAPLVINNEVPTELPQVPFSRDGGDILNSEINPDRTATEPGSTFDNNPVPEGEPTAIAATPEALENTVIKLPDGREVIAAKLLENVEGSLSARAINDGGVFLEGRDGQPIEVVSEQGVVAPESVWQQTQAYMNMAAAAQPTEIAALPEAVETQSEAGLTEDPNNPAEPRDYQALIDPNEVPEAFDDEDLLRKAETYFRWANGGQTPIALAVSPNHVEALLKVGAPSSEYPFTNFDTEFTIPVTVTVVASGVTPQGDYVTDTYKIELLPDQTVAEAIELAQKNGVIAETKLNPDFATARVSLTSEPQEFARAAAELTSSEQPEAPNTNPTAIPVPPDLTAEEAALRRAQADAIIDQAFYSGVPFPFPVGLTPQHAEAILTNDFEEVAFPLATPKTSFDFDARVAVSGLNSGDQIFSVQAGETLEAAAKRAGVTEADYRTLVVALEPESNPTAEQAGDTEQESDEGSRSTPVEDSTSNMTADRIARSLASLNPIPSSEITAENVEARASENNTLLVAKPDGTILYVPYGESPEETAKFLQNGDYTLLDVTAYETLVNQNATEQQPTEVTPTTESDPQTPVQLSEARYANPSGDQIITDPTPENVNHSIRQLNEAIEYYTQLSESDPESAAAIAPVIAELELIRQQLEEGKDSFEEGSSESLEYENRVNRILQETTTRRLLEQAQETLQSLNPTEIDPSELQRSNSRFYQIIARTEVEGMTVGNPDNVKSLTVDEVSDGSNTFFGVRGSITVNASREDILSNPQDYGLVAVQGADGDTYLVPDENILSQISENADRVRPAEIKANPVLANDMLAGIPNEETVLKLLRAQNAISENGFQDAIRYYNENGELPEGIENTTFANGITAQQLLNAPAEVLANIAKNGIAASSISNLGSRSAENGSFTFIPPLGFRISSSSEQSIYVVTEGQLGLVSLDEALAMAQSQGGAEARESLIQQLNQIADNTNNETVITRENGRVSIETPAFTLSIIDGGETELPTRLTIARPGFGVVSLTDLTEQEIAMLEQNPDYALDLLYSRYPSSPVISDYMSVSENEWSRESASFVVNGESQDTLSVASKTFDLFFRSAQRENPNVSADLRYEGGAGPAVLAMISNPNLPVETRSDILAMIYTFGSNPEDSRFSDITEEERKFLESANAALSRQSLDINGEINSTAEDLLDQAWGENGTVNSNSESIYSRLDRGLPIREQDLETLAQYYGFNSVAAAIAAGDGTIDSYRASLDVSGRLAEIDQEIRSLESRVYNPDGSINSLADEREIKELENLIELRNEERTAFVRDLEELELANKLFGVSSNETSRTESNSYFRYTFPFTIGGGSSEAYTYANNNIDGTMSPEALDALGNVTGEVVRSRYGLVAGALGGIPFGFFYGGRTSADISGPVFTPGSVSPNILLDPGSHVAVFNLISGLTGAAGGIVSFTSAEETTEWSGVSGGGEDVFERVEGFLVAGATDPDLVARAGLYTGPDSQMTLQQAWQQALVDTGARTAEGRYLIRVGGQEYDVSAEELPLLAQTLSDARRTLQASESTTLTTGTGGTPLDPRSLIINSELGNVDNATTNLSLSQAQNFLDAMDSEDRASYREAEALIRNDRSVWTNQNNEADLMTKDQIRQEYFNGNSAAGYAVYRGGIGLHVLDIDGSQTVRVLGTHTLSNGRVAVIYTAINCINPEIALDVQPSTVEVIAQSARQRQILYEEAAVAWQRSASAIGSTQSEQDVLGVGLSLGRPDSDQPEEPKTENPPKKPDVDAPTLEEPVAPGQPAQPPGVKPPAAGQPPAAVDPLTPGTPAPTAPGPGVAPGSGLPATDIPAPVAPPAPPVQAPPVLPANPAQAAAPASAAEVLTPPAAVSDPAAAFGDLSNTATKAATSVSPSPLPPVFSDVSPSIPTPVDPVGPLGDASSVDDSFLAASDDQIRDAFNRRAQELGLNGVNRRGEGIEEPLGIG